MNGQSVVGQWQAEILDLEEALKHLDRCKKHLKAEILQADGQGRLSDLPPGVPLGLSRDLQTALNWRPNGKTIEDRSGSGFRSRFR